MIRVMDARLGDKMDHVKSKVLDLEARMNSDSTFESVSYTHLTLPTIYSV